MCQLKSIIFMFLLCLLFSTTELFALDSNDNQQSLKQLNTGKIVIPETNHWGIADIRISLNNTLNRASVSLDGTKSRVKNSLDETIGNIRKSLNGTMDGIEEFFTDAGDIADVAVAAGAFFIYIMAATDDGYYYYDYNWNGGYDHSWPRSYDPWR